MAALQLHKLFSYCFLFVGSVQASKLSRRVAPDQSRRSMERLKFGVWNWRVVGSLPSETFAEVVRHSEPDLSLRPDSPGFSCLAPTPQGADQLIGWSLHFSTIER